MCITAYSYVTLWFCRYNIIVYYIRADSGLTTGRPDDDDDGDDVRAYISVFSNLGSMPLYGEGAWTHYREGANNRNT
jgi:hypothetical protein